MWRVGSLCVIVGAERRIGASCGIFLRQKGFEERRIMVGVLAGTGWRSGSEGGGRGSSATKGVRLRYIV